MIAYEDPNHKGNSPAYHTGETCITAGCSRPAGTLWSALWCFEYNVARIKSINNDFKNLMGED